MLRLASFLLPECTTVTSPQHTECEDSTLPVDPVSKKKRGMLISTDWWFKCSAFASGFYLHHDFF